MRPTYLCSGLRARGTVHHVNYAILFAYSLPSCPFRQADGQIVAVVIDVVDVVAVAAAVAAVVVVVVVDVDVDLCQQQAVMYPPLYILSGLLFD
jgi:predicted ATP-grasp superfamily ATP-dependent carboligase